MSETPGQAARDFAEFAAWWKAKGYRDELAFIYSDARDAFASGMRAARAATAVQEPAPALLAERDRFWNALFYIARRAPEYVPHAGPECVQVAKDAIDGTVQSQPAPELLAADNAEVAYERWIEHRDPAAVDSMAGFTAGWQEAIVAVSGWPHCPNGCGCRLGTEDADQRDCACDGLCCYDEIEVSELFAERDALHRQLAAQEAAPAPAATEALHRFAQNGRWLTCEDDGRLDMRAELFALKDAVREAFNAAARPAPAPDDLREPLAKARMTFGELAADNIRLREIVDQFTRHTVWPAREMRKVNGWRETAGLPPLDAGPEDVPDDGKTGGQIAYEAAVRVMLGDDPAGSDEGPDFAWDATGDLERGSWEAGVRAAVSQFRERLLALAARLEDEAERNDCACEAKTGREAAIMIRQAVES